MSATLRGRQRPLASLSLPGWCHRAALAGQGAGPSVLRVRDIRVLPAGPTGVPMRNGGGAGLITVRQVPATAARENNL